MTISIFFSINIYNLASREFNRGYGRQNQILNNPPETLPLDFRQQLQETRDEFVSEAKAHVLGSLIFTNIVVLIVGGGLSYVLAIRSLEPIEEAHRALERFTADASHELRTPIAAMKSEIEVALMQPKISNSEVRALLKSNLEELDTLTHLSEGLLRLARLEEGTISPKRLSAEQVVNEAVSRILPLAEKKNILVESKVKGSASIKVDKPSFIEAMVIVLDNAIKYSPEKSAIIVTMGRSDKHTDIHISDTGVGIDNKDLPHIFKRFYRTDVSRTKQNAQGHGLGLSIAKQIIDLHHGDISIKSKKDSGTTVTLSVPS